MSKTIRLAALALCLLLVGSLAIGCGNTASPSPAAPPADSGEPAAPPADTGDDAPDAPPAGERVTVQYWHTAKGDDIPRAEEDIATYNAYQDKVELVGTSVPEVAKVITAMNSGSGPDVFDVLGANVVPFAKQGMIAPIDELIASTGTDISEFPSNVMVAAKTDGMTYGLPSGLTIIALFYEKNLLRAQGYDDEAMKPQTFEELYEIGVDSTQTDDNGDITVLGFPVVPFKAYYMEGTYAFGGDFRPQTEDGTGPINIPEEAIRKTLELNMQFRETFGVDAVNRFAADAQTNRYTPQDAFFTGKMTYRMDGYWIIGNMIDFGLYEDKDIGIMPIPGGNGAPNGRTRLENGYLCISALSDPEVQAAAFDYMVYKQMGQGAEDSYLDPDDTGIPASTRLAELPGLDAKPGMTDMTDIVAMNNLVPFPVFDQALMLDTAINECFGYVYDGTKTIDQAIADLKAAAADWAVSENPNYTGLE